MTTHNPVTLSFIPTENIYIASPEKVIAAKEKGFIQTIQLLTQNLVCLNEPFRLVFVEANDDKLFYEYILKTLIRSELREIKIPISFRCLGVNKNDETPNEAFLDTRSKILTEELVDLFINVEDFL